VFRLKSQDKPHVLKVCERLLEVLKTESVEHVSGSSRRAAFESGASRARNSSTGGRITSRWSGRGPVRSRTSNAD
jgi:hypothetical protein